MENNSKAKECGQRLRRIRMAKNMSQQELAEKLFTTPQNISKYEKEGIGNIDTIARLNEILGYNLMRDEMDEEGSIGEIGKEILSVIVKNDGYIDVDTLMKKYMHGLDMKRTTNEIVKLQKIGLCVREQFIGYAGIKNDGLFITAKGIIALKNNLYSVSDEFKELIQKVPSFEEIVDGHTTYQEFLDSHELEKLLWQLPLSQSYRVNYIKYLKTTFQENVSYYGKDFDEETDSLIGYLEHIGSGYLSSVNVYFDILQRMIIQLDNATLNRVTEGIFDEYKFDVDETYMHSIRKGLILKYSPKYEKQRQMENIKVSTIRKFYELSDWYTEYAKESGIVQSDVDEFNEDAYDDLDQSLFLPEDLAIALEYEHLQEQQDKVLIYEAVNYDYYISKMAEKKKGLLITEWFSKEEIETFINENMAPAQTEEDRKIDEILMEINRQYPETLDYYVFPQEWEENGLADLVRKNCNIQ